MVCPRFLIAAMLVFLAFGAAAESTVRVVATHPDSDATLGRDESFYVRIEFNADEPVNIWARPFFRGKPVQRAKSNASFPHSGWGYALGWFSLDGVDAVDEVRIKLGGGKPYREWEVLAFPVKLTGTGMPVAQKARPEWVEELLREEEQRSREAYERRMSEPIGVGGMLFGMVFMLAVLALLVVGTGAPFWAIWKWRGGWRVAAAVPALVMAFVVGRIIVDTTIDPTSHNLWPFEILIWGGASAVAMGVLWLLRRLRAQGTASEE